MPETLGLRRLGVGREDYGPDLPGLGRLDRWFSEGTPGRPDKIREDWAQVWELMPDFQRLDGSTLIDVMRHMDRADQNQAFTLLEDVKSEDQLSIELLDRKDGVIDPETGLYAGAEKARFQELWDQLYHNTIKTKEDDRREYVNEQMASLAQFLSIPAHLEEAKNALSNINERLEKLIKERKKDIVETPNPLKDLPKIEVRNIGAAMAGAGATNLPYEQATNDWIKYVTTSLGATDKELDAVYKSTKEILTFLSDYRGGAITNPTIKSHFERFFDGIWLTYEKAHTKRLAISETVRKTETRHDRPWIYPDGRELIGHYHDLVSEAFQLYERMKIPQAVISQEGEQPRVEDPEELKRRISNILRQMYKLREQMKQEDDKIAQFDTVGFLQTVTKGQMLARLLVDAPNETEIWGFTTKIQRSREADRIIGRELEKMAKNPNCESVLKKLNDRITAGISLRPVEQRIKDKIDDYFQKIDHYIANPAGTRPVDEPEWTFQELRYAPDLAETRPPVYSDDRFLVINLRKQTYKTLKAILNGAQPLELPDGTIDTYENLRRGKKVIFIESPAAPELGGFGGANMEKFHAILDRDFGGDEDRFTAAWLENRRVESEGGRPVQEVINYFPIIPLARFYMWLKQVRELRGAQHSKNHRAIVYGISHSIDLTPAALHYLTGANQFSERVYSRLMDSAKFTEMEDMPLLYDENFVLQGGKFRQRATITNENLDAATRVIFPLARQRGLRGT